jgi:putative membrane protein
MATDFMAVIAEESIADGKTKAGDVSWKESRLATFLDFLEKVMAEETGGTKVSNEEYRMLLQLETSLLGWLRTSLSLMGFGFVIARFGLFLREIAQANQLIVHPYPWITQINTFTGTGLIVLGIVVLLLSVRNHQQTVERLHRGELVLPSRWSLSVIVCLLLAGLGMGLAIYLAMV